jgi:hypothetical protein
VIWGAILLAVGYEAVNLFRRTGHHSTDMTAGLPPSWRRWMVGESKKSWKWSEVHAARGSEILTA